MELYYNVPFVDQVKLKYKNETLAVWLPRRNLNVYRSLTIYDNQGPVIPFAGVRKVSSSSSYVDGNTYVRCRSANGWMDGHADFFAAATSCAG